MSLNVQMKLSLREDDPALGVIRRNMRIGERNGCALKRILIRYAAILDETPPPPAAVVSALYSMLMNNRSRNYLSVEGYAPLAAIIQVVTEAPVSEQQRNMVLGHLERISYPEYAKLMEAIESMA